MSSKLSSDRVNITSYSGIKSTSGAAAGDIYFDSDANTVRFFDGSSWIATNLIPSIDGVSGTIYTGEASTLTLTVSNTTDQITAVFYEGVTELGEATGTGAADGTTTVSVPSAVYNQSYNDVITIKIKNIDGTPSNNSVNTTVNARLGSSSRPASSVTAIKTAGDDSGDGVYWYNTGGATFAAYTNFSYNHAVHGTGWMLIGRMAAGTTFNILSANWTNDSTFGSTTSYTANDNMKNEGWKRVSHNAMMFQFESGMNADMQYTTATHNKNTTANGIFNWNNKANGFITFPEQFTTSGSYNTELNRYLDAAGYTDSRPGSPYGKLGLNVFMQTGTSSSGTEENWDTVSSGQSARSGCRFGFLGDGSSGGGVWPGQTGGPDDYFVGVSGQHCYDDGSCNVIVSSQYPGSYRMNSATNNNTGQYFTRCNLWIKN
jgi:hypothetical protein